MAKELDRDELIRRLEELRPEFEKLLLQHGAHEPDWGPLERVFGPFMFMGYSHGIRLYKHKYTRRYLNLDEYGRAYRYVGGKKDRYERIALEDGIARAFDDAEQLCWPIWSDAQESADGHWPSDLQG